MNFGSLKYIINKNIIFYLEYQWNFQYKHWTITSSNFIEKKTMLWKQKEIQLFV